jgi:hypothetical protein
MNDLKLAFRQLLKNPGFSAVRNAPQRGLAPIHVRLAVSGLGRDTNPAFKIKRLGAGPKPRELPTTEQSGSCRP